MLQPAPGSLPPSEKERLSELETIVERGLKTFVDIGTALLEIRDSHLYRENHATFDDYCRERWGWHRSYAYRLMDGAKVTALLSPIGDIPATETQARELVPLLREDEEQVAEVWQEIKEEHGEDVTADIIRGHVAERLGHVERVPQPRPTTPREEIDLFEVFKCPGCGYEGERPVFRLKGAAR